MRELTTEQRLNRIDENIDMIKKMLERLLDKQDTSLPKDDDCEIMTVKQVGQLLNLDPNIIYAKCGKGDIPYFRIGKGYRFRKADILKWVEGQKEAPEISVDDFVDQYLQKHHLKA